MQFFSPRSFFNSVYLFCCFLLFVPLVLNCKGDIEYHPTPCVIALRPGPASEPRSSVTPAAPHDPQQLPPDQVALRSIGDSTKGAAVSLL